MLVFSCSWSLNLLIGQPTEWTSQLLMTPEELARVLITPLGFFKVPMNYLDLAVSLFADFDGPARWYLWMFKDCRMSH